jgi:hypothetical protein
MEISGICICTLGEVKYEYFRMSNQPAAKSHSVGLQMFHSCLVTCTSQCFPAWHHKGDMVKLLLIGVPTFSLPPSCSLTRSAIHFLAPSLPCWCILNYQFVLYPSTSPLVIFSTGTPKKCILIQLGSLQSVHPWGPHHPMGVASHLNWLTSQCKIAH